MNNPRSVIGTNPKTIPHKRGSIISGIFINSQSQLLHRDKFL